MTRPFLATFTVACAALAFSGCGSGKASVSGIVKYRGKPLAMGMVFMTGPDQIQVQGAINSDGTYRIDNVAPGSVKIGVVSMKPSATTMRPAKKRANGGAAPAPASDVGWFEIPDKFGDPLTSGLTADMAPGANEHNIELQ